MGRLERYFIPRERPGHVRLRPAVILGFMESGKTTLSYKLARRIEERAVERGWGFVFIEGRRQRDILDYLRDNPDTLRGIDYVAMLYDDAARYYYSTERGREKREEIKDYFEVRHILEGLGFQRGVVAVFFNVQYWYALERAIRNTPLVIWKSLIVMDPSLKREVARRLGKYYYFLRVITKAIYEDGYRLVIPPRGRASKVYAWIAEYLRAQGLDPLKEIPWQKAMEYSVTELLDTKFILHTPGPPRRPEHYIRVPEPEPEPGEEDTGEIGGALELAYRALRAAGLSKRKAYQAIRRAGVKIGWQRFWELSREIDLSKGDL